MSDAGEGSNEDGSDTADAVDGVAQVSNSTEAGPCY